MMSHNRYNGGGHRRRYRDDYERREIIQETAEERLTSTIVKLGELDAAQEVPDLVKQLRNLQKSMGIPSISEGLSIAITEQPYKIPYYAAVIRQLHQPHGEAAATGSSIGRQLLDDLWKRFHVYVDKRAWRETRLYVHLFSHLAMAKIISPDSLLALLQSFTAVLEEFGVSHGRAKRAAICAGEGLMMAWPILKATSPQNVTDVITSIQAYSETITSSKWLVHPIVRMYSDSVILENADEQLDAVVAALKALDSQGVDEPQALLPRPYTDYDDLDSVAPPTFVLPSVLVPPEIFEIDGLSTESSEEANVKKEEWPEYLIRLFDNEITPNSNTPSGYLVRTALLDIIDIFEINRKECARLLLEYPKWTVPGTFKAKPGASAEAEMPSITNWQLESTIIETILGAFLILPESSHKSIYYISLITELCKLSPSTVGPAVGKSIRRLYNSLADGLDVEVSRRFAEWFAVHMSNFGFQWVWKEWIPDLAVTIQHPKRAFMRRALEFEMRLSYHDRIMKTLPAQMQAPESQTIQEEAPGPDFEYDDPMNAHHDAAQSVLNLFRGRAKAEDVISHLDTLKSSLDTTEDSVNIDSVVRFIAVQSLLHIGSRSFSHLLNAIERYLPLLRNLASGGVTGGSGHPEAKADILSASAAFWKRNRQMVNIVFDKLMQYQIVDPHDVVGWTFANGSIVGDSGPLSLSAFEWDLLKGALDKANGRVLIAKKKVSALRKEEDDTRARAKAGDVSTMEVDADSKQDDIPAVDNPILTTALKAFTSLTREQKAALSRTLDGFVSCLAPSPTDPNPNPHSREVITEQAWHNRANWGGDAWNAWETWSWYRQFCRSFAPYLRNYATTLSTVSFAKLEGSSDPAAELLKKTWSIAIGQDT